MKTVLMIGSDQLETEHVRALLQAIRDCEMANFPDKEISIRVEVPELTSDVVTELLASVRPPFEYGPILFRHPEGKRR